MFNCMESTVINQSVWSSACTSNWVINSSQFGVVINNTQVSGYVVD